MWKWKKKNLPKVKMENLFLFTYPTSYHIMYIPFNKKEIMSYQQYLRLAL